MREIAGRVAKLSDAERAELAARAPVTTCEGHALSTYNQVFLAYQSAMSLTLVAGFRQWLKAGRAVKQGQHAAGYIYVPMLSKSKAGDRETTKDPDDLRFRLVPVFDVTQTQEIGQQAETAAQVTA
jgi:hypothetical protein